MKIFESPAKIVFVLIALTVCAAFIWGKLDQDNFMMLAGMSFAFFFSYKGDTKPTDGNPPYAGK